MTTWDNICRICSSSADYEVFAKIPTYLHATSNEFLNWQKPINQLISDVTGLKITQDDGLPHCICAPCISYLKHACSFREQCINNALSLKVVGHYQQKTTKSVSKMKTEDKESLLITAQDLCYVEERPTNNLLLNNCNQQEQQDKVHKQLLNQTTPNRENYEKQMRYLNLLFDKETNAGLRPKYRNSNTVGVTAAVGSGGDAFADEEFQTATTSSDDNDDGAAKMNQNYFSYKEKNFEEDDIMDVDELRNAITINMPESCKERKCRACFRRFMFEESYNEHMNTCIELKFLCFIEELNRLLDIRRNKAVSPHEFIRRMIFCLRKTCDWLKLNCVEMLIPDLLQYADESKPCLESDGKSSITSSGELLPKVEQQKLVINPHTMNELIDLQENTKNPIESKPNNERLLEDVTDIDINSLFYTPQKHKSGNSTPISISNNILYEIERSESRNSNSKVKKPIAILATAALPIKATSTDAQSVSNFTLSKNEKNDAERFTFLEKLQNATNYPISSITSTKDPAMTPTSETMPNLLFSARCKICDVIFDTVASLEIHNAMNHNNKNARASREEDEERQRIIALFEDDI